MGDDVRARLGCSAEGCPMPAVETLWLRDQLGHVHDCAPHAHDIREWCDVTTSAPIVAGECQAKTCTGNEPVWFGQPAPLPDVTTNEKQEDV